jgi:uncharacterized protein (TIGR00255 family)
MNTYRVRSMTGYGRAQQDTDRGQFTVEIRTVNNRFLDFNITLPRELGMLETPLRTLIKQKLSRGKIDMRVRFAPNETQQPTVTLNKALAEQYLRQLGELQKIGCSSEIPVQLVASLPGVLETSATEIDEPTMWRHLQSVVDQALESLQHERSREGLAIGQQLDELGAALRERIGELDGRRAAVTEKYRERLLQRLAELLGAAKDQLDPGRLEQEAALMADKADITEEIVRLQAHLERFDQLLCNAGDEAVGKNVDFLVQEFSREINTICSKTRDTDLTSLGLEMKSTVEKIREQIQNVE